MRSASGKSAHSSASAPGAVWIGIDDHGPLLDGGTVFVPEFGTADENGRWIIEGHGVDPDIVVETRPGESIGRP